MNSKKALFIIIPVCTALVAAIVLAVLFATGTFLSPKARVMLALSRTFGSGSLISEYSGNGRVSEYGYAPEYLSDMLRASDAFDAMRERGYSFDSSFSLRGLETEDTYDFDALSGAGVKLSGDVDTINRLACYDLTLQYNFLRVDLGEYYINDHSISLSMPQRFEGYLTLPTDTFGASYNASPIASAIGPIPQELEPAISFSAYDLLCPSPQDKDSFINDMEENLSVLKEFYDAIEVEKTGETRPIYIGTKEQDCSEYRITVGEDAVLSLLEAYEDWFFATNEETIEKYETIYAYLAAQNPTQMDPSLTVCDVLEHIFDEYQEILAIDHEIYVYLDSKDRLVAASYENELDISGIFDNDFLSISEESADVISDIFDIDDIFAYIYFDVLDSSFPDADSIYADFTDSSDGSGTPESCEISAEIIFHGRDYLPERYEGAFVLACDNGDSCKIDFTGENRSETADMYHSALYAALDFTGGGETACYNVEYSSAYQTQDRNLTAELTAADENNVDVLNIALDNTLVLTEDGTIEWDLEDLTLTVNGETGKNSVSIAAEASVSPLEDHVPIPEGRERNLLVMNESDYMRLLEELLGFSLYY